MQKYDKRNEIAIIKCSEFFYFFSSYVSLDLTKNKYLCRDINAKTLGLYMFDFIELNNLTGLVIGFFSFFVIGLFHPLVIKGEYYFGVKCWWAFLVLGIVCSILSLCCDELILSVFLGVVAFSSFWSIGEVFEQRKRVERGWFPKRENKSTK